MMLEHLGWNEAAGMVREALERVIAGGAVTEDLAVQMGGVTAVSTSAFAEMLVRNLSDGETRGPPHLQLPVQRVVTP